MGDRGVRTQDVRRYAVQIRRVGSDQTQGTGILVSPQGHIVTCLHVIRALSGIDADAGDVVAEVILPHGCGERDGLATAYVCGDETSDLALVRLCEPPAGGLPAGFVASLGTAEDCFLHQFVSYGFRTLEDQVGGFAFGRILGPVGDHPGAGLSHPPLQLESAQISAGMSGSPVLDVERNLVVGVVTASWLPDETTKDRDTAWATDLANLCSLAPDIELLDGALPKGLLDDGPTLQLNPALVRKEVPGTFLETAPPPVRPLRGRESLIRQLDEDAADPHIALSTLVGLGGQGKSAILRAWVDERPSRRSAPVAVYWWSFDAHPDVNDFFQHALRHFVDPQKAGGDFDALFADEVRAPSLARAVRARPTLLILDGVEAVFRPGAPGLLVDDLRTLVRMLASYGEVVQCVITSRLPVADLIDIDSHRSHTVGPLGPAQAVHVLRDLGVEGDQATLLRLADDLDRHALSLTLAGAFIRRQHDGDPSRFRSLDDLPSGHTADDLTRRVERILEDYGGLVSDEQLALLQVLAVHRVPVREVILDRLTQPERGRDHLLQPLTSLATRRQYEQLVDSLADMGLVMRDEDARTLSCHVLVKGYFARKVTAAPSPRQREFYWAIARAHLRHVAPATYGKLGLGTAGFLGALAMRRVLPQTLVLAGQAAKGDPMLREALHFIGRMRKVEETSQT